MFDNRLLRVGVEVNGQIRWYEGLQIKASIQKFANPTQNEATIQVSNMSAEVRNFILTETTPFNMNFTRKKIYVEAGRESTGLFRVYEGDIMSVTPSQPPDIMLTFKSKTSQFEKTNIVARSAGEQVQLSALAKSVASDMGLNLVFEAPDKKIASYQFIGATIQQVGKLSEFGNVNAYVDDGQLIVKAANQPIRNVTHVLSKDSGMIGVPEATEQGIKVTYLLDQNTRLGGAIQLVSSINPSLNGTYTIYKLGYELANRDTAFYNICEASKPGRILQ